MRGSRRRGHAAAGCECASPRISITGRRSGVIGLAPAQCVLGSRPSTHRGLGGLKLEAQEMHLALAQ